MSAKPAKPIENWSTTMECPSRDPYLAPEADPHVHLQGTVEGRRGVVLTTRVVSSRGRIVTTRSGSRYRLGAPAPAFLVYLASKGLAFDEKQPVKVLVEAKPPQG